MTDKKTTIITIISMMISLLLITIGLSFAYFTANITGTENTTTINVSGGMMNIHYSGGENINAPNIEPDSAPFATKTFTLTGNNTTTEDMRYHILLIIEENTFTDNSLQYKLISTNTNDNGAVAPSIEEPTGIPTGNNNEIFLGNGMFESPTEGNKLHTYNLELYFPDTEEDQNENQGKIFKAYINIKENKYEYNQIKGVNHPVLFTGMKPVIWDENNDESYTTENDPDWYDYDEKRWANAKSADGSYWVWIPRYAYKITSGYHSSETGTIDVKFLKGRTNEALDDTVIETEGYEPGVKDTSMHHFLHPAFQFNGEELGFWVAKYEPTAREGISSQTESCSGNDNTYDKTPLIAPNKTAWRCINVSNAYKVSLAMKDNPIYGWHSNEVDTHMMTNQEWGAVAYLSKSEYGAPSEVWNNSFTGFKTGCSGPSVSAYSQPNCDGFEYNTENGVKASTTHNIYGVYDMSGGAWERVMGNYNGLVATSGFDILELIKLHSKYITRYNTTDTNLLNNIGMNYNILNYGDAVFESSSNAGRYNGSDWEGLWTGSWYSDVSYLPHTTKSWFHRGGNSRLALASGLFGFSDDDGASYWLASFRPAIFSLP